MAMASNPTRKPILTPNSIPAATLWYCAFVFMALILLSSFRTDSSFAERDAREGDIKGKQLSATRPCDEIYVVGEGETLHTISDKCGDPFIVEQNPQIQDPDDVFPGLVIKITPLLKSRKLLG